MEGNETQRELFKPEPDECCITAALHANKRFLARQLQMTPEERRQIGENFVKLRQKLGLQARED